MAWIIIDGYNLLPTTGLKNRDLLIEALRKYKKTRNHRLTVVFDGTHQGTGFGDHYHDTGIEIIFTPLTITADDHIESLLNEASKKAIVSGTIVVSTDRRIQKAASRVRASFVNSGAFATTMLSAGEPNFQARQDADDRAESGAPKEKKGNPRKLSKKDRAKRRAFKKL